MGKNKKMRLLARSLREAEKAQGGALFVEIERLPPSNEHTLCPWHGPTRCGGNLLAQANLISPEPEPEPELDPRREPGAEPAPGIERAGLPLCTLPLALRVEQLHRYNTSTYPFADLIAEIIRPDSFVGPLSEIHRSSEVQNWLAGVKKDNARAYTMRRNYVDKRYKSSGAFRPGTPTGECYQRFLREVVRPTVYAGLGLHDGSGGCAILYQREPNFRCHLPHTGHLLVHKHCDADYHHQQNEINFWLPVTRAFGNNTLWSESTPGAEDYHPFELDVGEMKQFWGNQCVHYTVPNDTDHTRITVDFRIIPLPQCATIPSFRANCLSLHPSLLMHV